MLSCEEIKTKHFSSSDHPYRQYEAKIEAIVDKSHTILDAGCGRTAPILNKFAGKAHRLIGVDLEKPADINKQIQYIQSDIANINIPGKTVDIVISRAVLEHIVDPDALFQEINRILKPEGSFIFLAPNLFDYVSLASKIIPNKYHQYIVSKAEGRNIADVFPAYYKANTFKAINKLCQQYGFTIESFQWIGQYPSMLMFNPYIFMMGVIYEKIISQFEALRFLRGWILVHLIKK